jgi:hypothetical protein
MLFKKEVVLKEKMIREEDVIAKRHKDVVVSCKGVDKCAVLHQNITIGCIAEYLRSTDFVFKDGVMTPESLASQLTDKIKKLKSQWREL